MTLPVSKFEKAGHVIKIFFGLSQLTHIAKTVEASILRISGEIYHCHEANHVISCCQGAFTITVPQA